MSNVQVTPRKRQAAAPGTPPSTARQRTRNAPAANPPLAPFPTPPRSRSKNTDALDDSLSSNSDTQSSQETTPNSSQGLKAQPPVRLPAHLQTLLALQKGLSVALSLHIASNPPVLPPHSASATTIQLPNLTNLAKIKQSVEKASGKQFGQQELARLAWLWTWDGETLPAESSSKKQDTSNPFLVSDVPKAVSGLTFLVTSTRTLDPSGRRINTHGIGLELELLRPGETRELLMGGAVGGFGNQGVGGGVRIFGRWSAAAESRDREMRRRLERWVELHGGETLNQPSTHLPSPLTRDSERSSIPPIPLLPLPQPTTFAPSSPSLFSSPSRSSPSPSKEPGLTSLPMARPIPEGLSDPFEIQKPKAVVHKGSVSERRQALYDRIKAKESSKRVTLGEAVKDTAGVIHRSPDQNEVRRRATLSRLEGVAETVWFIFSSTPGSSSSPRAVRRPRREVEVSEQVVKSSKTPISLAEAQTSIQMLMQLCPFFLQSKTVGNDDWLEMPLTVVAPPISPGKELALGPASPGRVRRSAGLRDVRERIRRELERGS